MNHHESNAAQCIADIADKLQRPYQVIDTSTGQSHGRYATLAEARGCVTYDGLRAWEIWWGSNDLVVASIA